MKQKDIILVFIGLNEIYIWHISIQHIENVSV